MHECNPLRWWLTPKWPTEFWFRAPSYWQRWRIPSTNHVCCWDNEVMMKNPHVQTMKMFLIEAHHFLHNCSIFRTIDPGADSFGQTMLTTVALKVWLRSKQTLLHQICAMFLSSLQRILMNTVEAVVIHHFAARKGKEQKNRHRISVNQEDETYPSSTIWSKFSYENQIFTIILIYNHIIVTLF